PPQETPSPEPVAQQPADAGWPPPPPPPPVSAPHVEPAPLPTVSEPDLDRVARELAVPVPEVSFEVDLTKHGLGDISDVPLQPAVVAARPIRLAADEPVTMSLGEDESYSRNTRTRALAIIGAIVVVAIAVALIAGLGRGGGAKGAHTTTPSTGLRPVDASIG